MAEFTGAQALVSALVSQGTRYLFGIPGVHTLPLYDALANYPQLVDAMLAEFTSFLRTLPAPARVLGLRVTGLYQFAFKVETWRCASRTAMFPL